MSCMSQLCATSMSYDGICMGPLYTDHWTWEISIGCMGNSYIGLVMVCWFQRVTAQLYYMILYYTILYTIHTIKCRHSAQCGHRNVGSFKRRSWNFAAPRSPCPPSWPKLGWTKPGKWGWKLSHGDIIEVSWVIKWRSNGDIVGNW